MNNEIKEILDKLGKKSSIYKFQINQGTSFNTDEYEASILLDYITNLQEENEDLREENKEAHDFDETMKDIKDNLIARINRQECEIHNLQQRINKAVEYVKSNEFIGKIRLSSENKQSINKLLDILKGSDKE